MVANLRFHGYAFGMKKRNNLCACGCGAAVSGTWKRGHASGRSVAAKANRMTHGEGNNRSGRSPAFVAWTNMIQRCTNMNRPDFYLYGGRGVTVCDRWLKSGGGFAAFVSDMGPRPPGSSIDRIDNSEGYGPSNCRWATPAEQARNRSTSRLTADMVARLRSGDLRRVTAAEAASAAGVAVATVNAIRCKVPAGWKDVP